MSLSVNGNPFVLSISNVFAFLFHIAVLQLSRGVGMKKLFSKSKAALPLSKKSLYLP